MEIGTELIVLGILCENKDESSQAVRVLFYSMINHSVVMAIRLL